MAALKPAVDRITYIITGEGKRIASTLAITVASMESMLTRS